MTTKTYGDKRKATKEPCIVALTANVTLATPGATLDGVTMATAANPRFLCTGQTAGAEDGIYDWNGATTAATRSDDANTTEKVKMGQIIPVTGGTYAGSTWVAGECATLDTTDLSIVQAAGSVASLIADLVSNANGSGASTIGIEDAATIYTATDAEAALAEVKVIADANAVIAAAATAENTDGKLWVPATDFQVVSGTWALSEASDVAVLTRTADAGTDVIRASVRLPARTTASKGRQIDSVEFVYSANTAVADDIIGSVVATTLTADGTAPTAAAVAVTFDAAHDSAAERADVTGAPEEHTATATVDTPAYEAALVSYDLRFTVDGDAGAAAAVIFKGARVLYSETLVDAA